MHVSNLFTPSLNTTWYYNSITLEVIFLETIAMPLHNGEKKESLGIIAFILICTRNWGFPGLVVKNLPANAGDIRDAGSIPGWERSPGGRHDNPLQYS